MDPPWIDGPAHWGDPRYETDMIDSFTGKHRFLSSFYLCSVTYTDVTYASAEHAYQTSKTLDAVARRRIRSARTPAQAKKFGQQATMRKDWEVLKLMVMRAIVSAKFEQNPELRRRLLATGDEQLVEGNWWNDTFWGVYNGEGENHLGRILMEVREELR